MIWQPTRYASIAGRADRAESAVGALLSDLKSKFNKFSELKSGTLDTFTFPCTTGLGCFVRPVNPGWTCEGRMGECVKIEHFQKLDPGSSND